MTANHQLLYRITELMLNHEQHVLPVDLLFDDEEIGNFVKSIQIDSPYQQMLLEGVLTESVRDEKLFVSFTVEGYFHFVLGEVIYNRTEGLGAEPLKLIVEENKLNGAKEGLEQCLIRDMQKDDLVRLMWLVDSGGEAMDICSVPMAHAFLQISSIPKKEEEWVIAQTQQVKRVMDELLAAPTDNDIIVLEKSIQYLENAQKNSMVRLIYLRINEVVHPDNLKKALLYIKSIKHISVKDRNIKLHNLSLLKIEAENEDAESFYNSLGQQYNFIANHDRAIEYFEKALTLRRNIFGDKDSKIVIYHNNIGTVYSSKGCYNDALNYYNKSLEYCLMYFKKDSINLADVYNNIGFNYYLAKDYVKSASNYFDSLKIYLNKIGTYTKEVATSYNNLGLVYSAMKDFGSALQYHNKSLEIRLKIFGKKNYNVGISYNNIASVFYKQNNLNQSLSFFKKSLMITINCFGRNHPMTATCYNNIGGVYKSIQDYNTAIKYSKKSSSIKSFYYGDKHPEVAKAFSNLGSIYKEINENKKAIHYFRKSIKINKINFGENHFILLTDFICLAKCHEALNNVSKAFSNYLIALEICLNKTSIDHDLIVDLYFSFGEFLQKIRKYEDAILNYINGFKFQRVGGFPLRIAECYLALNNKPESLNYFIQSAEIRKEQLGIDDENTLAVIQKSKELASQIGQYDSLPQWMKGF
jgi:tetratricopeptide (TPR) repeat protein